MAHALTRSSASESRMNLATLTRVDPYVQEIVCQAKHVFLYYHKDGNWEKGDTEGPLFVYERVCEPKYGFIILNRLNQRNLIEPISKGLEFQSKPPFMLYKTKDEEIRGIWFYKEEECKMISAKVESLITLTEEAALQNQRAEHPPKDLASLLSKASSQKGGGTGSASESKTAKAKVNPKSPKTAVEKVKPPVDTENGGNKLLRMLSSSANGSALAPSGLAAEGNVAAFFAQANQGPFGPPPPHQQPPVALMPDPRAPLGPHGPMIMRPPIMMPMMPPGMPHLMPDGNFQPMVSGAGSIPLEPDGKQLLQRLMSNAGVHSLEDLERDQRIQSQSPNPPRMPPLPADAMKADDIESIMGQKLTLNSASYAAAVSGLPQDPPISQPNATLSAHGTPNVKQEPQELKLISPFDLVAPAVSTGSTTPFNAPQRSLIKEEPLDVYENNGASPNLIMGKLNGPPSTSSMMPNGLSKQGRSDITPLTKEQLLQAFEHLLNSDPSFIGKLHQAYVESLNTKLH